MKPRLSSLDGSVLVFAHRGASAHAPENTIEAFSLACRLGATGVETDAWLTADGVAVLHHDGLTGSRLRRRRFGELDRANLPADVPTIDELYALIGSSVEVSIDLKDPATFEPVVASARAAGAEEQLWLCHPDLDVVTGWREHTTARLVLSTRVKSFPRRPEHTLAELRARAIDALNLPHREWNGGLIALCHRFERYAFGWGLEHEREMAQLIDTGIDALYSDHVDRMVAVVAQFD